MAERSVHIRIAVKDLEAARARLASLGVEGEDALNKIERGAPRAAAGLDQVDRSALRAGRNIRFAMGNAAAQIQDVVVSLQAGQQPLTVLIQQGSQLASAFGPVGVILGTVGALLVAGVSAWIGYRDATQDAGEEVKRFEETQDALQSILGDTTQKIHDQADAIADLQGASRAFGIEALNQQLALANANLEREKNALTTSLGDIEAAILRAGEARSLGSPFGQGQADEIRPGVLETLAAIQQAQASGAVDELAANVARLAREMEDPALAEFADKLTKSGLSAKGAETEIAALEKALQDLAQGTTQSSDERAQADRAAEDSAKRSAAERIKAERDVERATAASLRRSGQQYEELARIAQTFVRQSNQDRFRAVQAAERERQREIENQARAAERERERLADQAARELQRPFDTAAQNIQNTMTDVFETIYSGGVTSFEDIAAAATQIFTRLAAELTTLMIIRPQLLMGGGVGGAGTSLASQLGFAGAGAAGVGAAGVLNPAAGTPTSTPVTGPGGMLVGGGVTSSAGAPASGGFFTPAVLGAGLAGVGVGTVAGGLIGGSQVGSLAGSAVGAIAGGAIGTAIPIIGTAVGAFAGGALGGLIGGFFGGGNGSPGAANNTGRLSFGTTAGAGGPFGRVAIGGDSDFVSALAPMIQQFDEGVAEFLTSRQEDAVGQALQALEEFTGRFPEADPSKAFQAIIEQRTRTVLETGFPGISADAVLEGNTGVEDIAQRLKTALQTQSEIERLTGPQGAGAALNRELEEIGEGFDELRANAELYGIAIDGLSAAEKRAIQDAKDAAKDPIREQILQLTQGQTPGGRLSLELRQIDKDFEELTKTANELGISTKGLAAAEELLIQETKDAVKDPIRQEILQLTVGSTPAGALELELAQIEKHFDELNKEAKELGISTKGLAEAEERAIQGAIDQAAAIDDVTKQEAELARQRREQIKEEKQSLLLSIPARFDALSDPLEALRTQIKFENKNPTQQFEAARKDFERLVRQAEKGNLDAIAQLPGAAELFRRSGWPVWRLAATGPGRQTDPQCGERRSRHGPRRAARGESRHDWRDQSGKQRTGRHAERADRRDERREARDQAAWTRSAGWREPWQIPSASATSTARTTPAR